MRISSRLPSNLVPILKALSELGKLPVWLIGDDSKDIIRGYGFPLQGILGFKLGVRNLDDIDSVDPDTINRNPTAKDEQKLRKFVRTYFPLADDLVMKLQVCMYTATPDRHFILDLHPNNDNLIMISCWLMTLTKIFG